MKHDFIQIKGARVHNLQNVSLKIPKNKLVVFTGVSGSGKSSLAFDTLYAEGQRRYIESLSAYARQFLGQLDKPDVESIEGLSPAIAIEQKTLSHNPRSTVGTTTEIYDYLRLLFARCGRAHCPKCGRVVSKQSTDQIVTQIMNLPPESQVMILGPVVQGKKGLHSKALEEVARQGFVRARVNGQVLRLEEALKLDFERYKTHTIEVVVDRVIIPKAKAAKTGLPAGRQALADERTRLADSVETALKIGRGVMIVSDGDKDQFFSSQFACVYCGVNLPEIEPRSFSFNNPRGACEICHGLGTKLEISEELVVPDPNLSLGQGAIMAWSSASHRLGRQSWYWYQLQELAHRLGFSTERPYKSLPPEVRQSILNGHKDGRFHFEGVVPNLLRRYQETESEYTREEIKKYMVERECPGCAGRRLRPEFLAVKFLDRSIADLVALNIIRALAFFSAVQQKEILKRGPKVRLTENEAVISRPIIREIVRRLTFLQEVGVGYLTLDRRSGTLAGGEAQRIQLATQIGSGLTGGLYILDEPSIGLHQRDQNRLIETLKNLRDLGNTVIVVEHDRQTMLQADWLVDMGPRGGKNGGLVIGEGTPAQVAKLDSLTGAFLRGAGLDINFKAHPGGGRALEGAIKIINASEHNLKNVSVSLPLGKLLGVTGVSGSGKSTLIQDILGRALLRHFYGAKELPGKHEKIEGFENIDRVVVVDQSPIGRTPRSNPATYTGIFSQIRDLFSVTTEARARGYKPGRFSFNVASGRCETCEGQGLIRVEMQFLPDVYVTCDVCQGKRYLREVLEVQYKGKNIAEILNLSIEDARGFFKHIPPLKKRLDVLYDIGLDYVELGQSATTLSGGEAQRIKLAKELTSYQGHHTLYLLDEPTTGLHHADIAKLLSILKRLVVQGNTVIVIEHNLDVIAQADWILDMGPDGGEAGGQIVATGTPQEIVKVKTSYTGRYLAPFLAVGADKH